MPSGDKITIDGVLLRGEDAVYLIPADELEGYRLPAEMARPAREALDDKLGPEVAGFGQTFQVTSPSVGSVQLKNMPAIFGPIGIRDLTASPTSPTQHIF